jgi:MoaA/NifB/PqqE/SkfB family radical SAM enzyme
LADKHLNAITTKIFGRIAMIYCAGKCEQKFCPDQSGDILSAGGNSEPRYLFIETSSKCNLQCKRCEFHHAKAKNFNKQKSCMSMNTLHLIMDNLILMKLPFKVAYFNLHGEPLLNPHIDEMIHIVHEHNIAERYSISTNGIMLTDAKLNRLINAGIDSVEINLDTARLNKYMELKGDNQLDIVLDNIVNALEVISSHSRTLNLYIKCAFQSECNGISEDDIESVMLYFKKHAENSKKIHIEICKEINCYKRNSENIFSNKQKLCEMPFSQITMHHDGMVSFCCRDINYDMTLGKITHAYSLFEMLKGKELRQIRELHLSQDLESMPACKTCMNRPITQSNLQKETGKFQETSLSNVSIF